MFADNLRLHIKQMGYWSGVAIMVVALKQFYSAATAAQLQWQLYPLVLLLESFSDLLFEQTANGDWLDAGHRISIVKACAGINFLIISLLGYCWLWRDRLMPLWVLLRAFFLAWLTALLANSLRILLCLYAQEPLAALLGSSEAAIHRLIGITIYFLCLWSQLSAFKLHRFRQRAVTAALIYLSVTAVIPLLKAILLGIALPNAGHLLWVFGFPALLLTLGMLLKFVAYHGALDLLPFIRQLRDRMPLTSKHDMVAGVHLFLGKLL